MTINPELIRIEQRFVDKERTRKLEGHFNIFHGKRYCGSIYRVGQSWQYGGAQHERTTRREDAAVKLIELHQYYNRQAKLDRN